MWFRNTRTGVEWEVTADDLVARLSRDPKFEPCDPPTLATHEAPGGAVLRTATGEPDTLAPPPGETPPAQGVSAKPNAKRKAK